MTQYFWNTCLFQTQTSQDHFSGSSHWSRLGWFLGWWWGRDRGFPPQNAPKPLCSPAPWPADIAACWTLTRGEESYCMSYLHMLWKGIQIELRGNSMRYLNNSGTVSLSLAHCLSLFLTHTQTCWFITFRISGCGGVNHFVLWSVKMM